MQYKKKFLEEANYTEFTFLSLLIGALAYNAKIWYDILKVTKVLFLVRFSGGYFRSTYTLRHKLT